MFILVIGLCPDVSSQYTVSHTSVTPPNVKKAISNHDHWLACNSTIISSTSRCESQVTFMRYEPGMTHFVEMSVWCEKCGGNCLQTCSTHEMMNKTSVGWYLDTEVRGECPEIERSSKFHISNQRSCTLPTCCSCKSLTPIETFQMQ